MNPHSQYWTQEDMLDICQAATFEELANVALRIIGRMPQPVAQVCGPISTGGSGSLAKNMEVFQRTIIALSSNSVTVFDQLMFEPAMQLIKETPYNRGGAHLLEAFYLPIFKSGHIKKLYFIHGWESSLGACWEHERALELGIPIEYLPADFGGTA